MSSLHYVTRRKMPRLFCCLSYCNRKKLCVPSRMQSHLGPGSPTCALSILQHFYSRQGITDVLYHRWNHSVFFPYQCYKTKSGPEHLGTRLPKSRYRHFCCFHSNRNIYSLRWSWYSQKVLKKNIHCMYIGWITVPMDSWNIEPVTTLNTSRGHTQIVLVWTILRVQTLPSAAPEKNVCGGYWCW